jgi:hypothetical protein
VAGRDKVVCCEIFSDAGGGNVWQGGANSWGMGWGYRGWWLMHRTAIVATRGHSGPYYVKQHPDSEKDLRWRQWLVRNY